MGSGEGTTRRKGASPSGKHFFHLPAHFGFEPRFRGHVIERADRLARMLEIKIVPVNKDLGDHSDYIEVQVVGFEFVHERLLEKVSQLPLGHGIADVHGLGRDLGSPGFLLHQEVAHLGAVSVGDHHVKPMPDEFQDMAGCGPDTGQLFFVGAPLAGKLDGIPPRATTIRLRSLFIFPTPAESPHCDPG